MNDEKQEVLAIIPARGGSKGIPRKNIRLVGGKPLIAHTIERALSTPSINRTIVSTDDEEIADVSRQCGAEVVVRPVAISGDEASSESALSHVLGFLKEKEGYEPDLVVFLQATSPLRRPDDIQKAVELIRKEGADSLFSACPVRSFIWKRRAGQLKSLDYDPKNRPRRQDREEESLMENGSIYIFKTWVLEKHKSRLGGKITVYPMEPFYSFEVDEPPDLELMNKLMNIQEWNMDRKDLFKDIRLLVLDFDGVMTDNRVLIDQEGKEAVWCNRGDGLGIDMLQKEDVEVVVLSKETNPVVAARCRKLGINCVQACDDKLSVLKKIANERSLDKSQVAYVGNDINDLECLKWAGLPVAVADALPEVKAASRLVTIRPGGYGAVREIADWILGDIKG